MRFYCAVGIERVRAPDLLAPISRRERRDDRLPRSGTRAVTFAVMACAELVIVTKH
jgi:hypothetical protein